MAVAYTMLLHIKLVLEAAKEVKTSVYILER